MLRIGLLCSGSNMKNVVVVVVHENAQRLPENEWYPHGHIARLSLEVLVHKDGEGQLHDHTAKGPQAKHVQRHGDEVLVVESRQKKDHRWRPKAVKVNLILVEQWEVDVPHQVGMHRNVPCRPESAHRLRVPPVLVELSVREAQQFGEEIEEGVKEAVEEDEPDEVIRHCQL